jgi:hypothetical protein
MGASVPMTRLIAAGNPWSRVICAIPAGAIILAAAFGQDVSRARQD